MKTKDLVEYLDIIADMENNIYLQKSIIQELKAQSLSLGKTREINLPASPVNQVTTKKKVEKAANSIFIPFCYIAGIAGIIIVIMGILTFVVNKFSFSILMAGGLFIGLGLALAGWGFDQAGNSRKSVQGVNRLSKQYTDDIQQYEQSMAQYNQALLDEKTRIDNENKEKAFLDLEINAAKMRLSESEKKLQEMYDLGIVYPKYRDMVMINSICEYLKSGRCSTLEGPSGAYNILELEIRLDKIILQLDRILANLNQIKQSQYMLYCAIAEGNTIAYKIAESTKSLSKQLDSIQLQQRDYTQELQKLQASSSLTSYNTERIQKELHYMNRMKYFAGEYNGEFFNLPPN